MTVSSSALMTILLVTVVVFCGAGGRSQRRVAARAPAAPGGAARPRPRGALSTALGVVLGIFIVVAYITAVLIQGRVSPRSSAAGALPNLVLLALGMDPWEVSPWTRVRPQRPGLLPAVLGRQDGGDAYAWTWFGAWSILLFAAMIGHRGGGAARGVRRSRTGRTECSASGAFRSCRWPWGRSSSTGCFVAFLRR